MLQAEGSGKAGVQLELLVRHDGSSDLPSSVEHMMRWMRMRRCLVVVGDVTLIPQPDSVVTEHKFSLTPSNQPTVGTWDTGKLYLFYFFILKKETKKNIMFIAC